MGADACPVPEGEGSWLSLWEKLTTEAPVNGGRNYCTAGRRIEVRLGHENVGSYKIWLYAGISRYSLTTRSFYQ